MDRAMAAAHGHGAGWFAIDRMTEWRSAGRVQGIPAPREAGPLSPAFDRGAARPQWQWMYRQPDALRVGDALPPPPPHRIPRETPVHPRDSTKPAPAHRGHPALLRSQAMRSGWFWRARLVPSCSSARAPKRDIQAHLPASGLLPASRQNVRSARSPHRSRGIRRPATGASRIGPYFAVRGRCQFRCRRLAKTPSRGRRGRWRIDFAGTECQVGEGRRARARGAGAKDHGSY